jgi:hypothetical protein
MSQNVPNAEYGAPTGPSPTPPFRSSVFGANNDGISNILSAKAELVAL